LVTFNYNSENICSNENISFVFVLALVLNTVIKLSSEQIAEISLKCLSCGEGGQESSAGSQSKKITVTKYCSLVYELVNLRSGQWGHLQGPE